MSEKSNSPENDNPGDESRISENNNIPENSYKFYRNLACQYYPCHEGIEALNCLFCFCPLYPFKNCGGNYKLTKKGIKDCTGCIIPHKPENYDYIVKRLKELNSKGLR